MKNPQQLFFQSKSRGLWLVLSPVLVIAGLNVFSMKALAQGLEESIESELDRPGAQEPRAVQPPPQIESAPPPEPPAPAAPSAPAPVLAPAAPVVAEPPAAPVSSGGDEPNLEFEKRIYRIFHNAQPVSNEKWDELLGARRADVYKVEPGDNMWNISKTMFGDGFYWSKLWAENSDVENPHRISKGHGIRFISGTASDAPSVDVVKDTTRLEPIRVNALIETRGQKPLYIEDAKALMPQQNDGTIETEELIPQPEIPPGKPKRPLGEIPPSFKPPVKAKISQAYDSTGLDVKVMKSLTEHAVIIPPSLIFDRRPRSVGEVEEIEASEKFASIGQNVFIRLRRSAHIGERFSTLLERGNIEDPKLGSVGPVMEVGGQIEVTDAIDSGKFVYRAMVLQNVNPVRLGSLVMEESLPRVSFARKGTLLMTEVRIIGAEHDEERKIIGEGSVVYLGGVEKAGLNAGDLLVVQSRREPRWEGSNFPDIKRSVGIVKVIKVDREVATAMIIEAHDDIRVGDVTGGTIPKPLKEIRMEKMTE
jgi:hypothetical protein